ncbi:MAG: hypothetical protein ACP6IY_00955 [Promethearchaeia archaeon]
MFENLINLRKIKNYSIEFIKELRFKSKYLYIYTKSGYCSFSKIESFESLGNDDIIPITLEDILLDTGNSTGYCLIAKEFEEPINRIFFNNELEFEEKLISSVSDKYVSINITKKALKFRLFNNTYFLSRIGFLSYMKKRMKTTINIGIYSINQFLNLLFFIGSQYYYFCSNIKI